MRNFKILPYAVLVLLAISVGSGTIGCKSDETETEKFTKELEKDPETAIEDTVEILDEGELISKELDEDLNKEMDIVIDDDELDVELEDLIGEKDSKSSGGNVDDGGLEEGFDEDEYEDLK